jgi:leucyl-tRNA synthetase
MRCWLNSNLKAVASSASTNRLRDWLVSRQRYWGTPIRLSTASHAEPFRSRKISCRFVCPTMSSLRPMSESPLKKCTEFIETVRPIAGVRQHVMPINWTHFVCSSMYHSSAIPTTVMTGKHTAAIIVDPDVPG